jgi:hypothetical protein
MVLVSGAILFGLISSCLAIPHHNIARGTASFIPTSTLSQPIETPTTIPSDDQKKHSKHVNDFYKLYGWLKPGTSVSDKDLPEAIRKIQRIMNEPVTGKLSEKMMSMMSGPRCGVEQPYVGTEAGEHRDSNGRYELLGPKWAQTTLTWRMKTYSNGLTRERQLEVIRSACSP